MPSAPTAAIILAAGTGSRLQRLHPDQPKGLLRLGGTTLLERSLRLLHACGIERVLLVAGYRAGAYRDLLAACHPRPDVELLLNPEYARTGSMHSLATAAAAVTGEVLVLESDLLFEPRAVAELLDPGAGDRVLVSGPTGQGDEVYAYGSGERLALLSKARRPDLTLLGEFVGISRLNRRLLEAMTRHYERSVPFPSPYHYDDCLGDLAATHPIRVHLIRDLVWAEIDDEAQHRRAVEVVLPTLDRQPVTHAPLPGA